MYYHCDRCGFELNYTGARSQQGMPCRVCDLGHLQAGQAAGGFSVDAHFQPVPRNLIIPAAAPIIQGDVLGPSSFNYFSGIVGGRFKQYVQANTLYVSKFTNILVNDPKQFAWLTPYTGNKHNRTLFTQLLLAKVARAKFVDNQGRLPRLIEPFVGSGQIFFNACQWSRALNQGMPLFKSVVGGDLNHYVIGVYRGMKQIGADFCLSYFRLAKKWDVNMKASYTKLVLELNQGGKAAMLNHGADPKAARMSAYKYIWLVNRCKRGTKLNDEGGLVATLNPDSLGRAKAIRARETRTLGRVLQMLHAVDVDLEYQDFSVTCDLATPQDIVFMDCPFPKFSMRFPADKQPHPELCGAGGVNTYGIPGGEQASLQTLIVNAAERLVKQGTTVIICNFANPGLVQAYAGLIGDNLTQAQKQQFIYTYRSPSTQSEAYQLTILPGAGNAAVSQCPDAIFNAWVDAKGDNYRTQNFFKTQQLDLSSSSSSSSEEEQEEYEPQIKRRKTNQHDVEDDGEFYLEENDYESEYEDAEVVDDFDELMDDPHTKTLDSEDEH